jgi:hypothetical protein
MDANILSKIQKCMNLGKSSEPNEAAAAMRQAAAMMRKHGITQAEIDAIGYGNEKVSCPIQANKKLPIALATLINLIRKAFGVEPVIETEIRVSDASYVVRYFGPSDRVALAAYTHVVIFRAMNAAWDDYLEANPSAKGKRGARAGFQLGWLDAVTDQITELAMTEAEQAGTNVVKTKHYGDTKLVVKGANNMKINGRAMDAGNEAGSGFSLRRPVDKQNLRIGK